MSKLLQLSGRVAVFGWTPVALCMLAAYPAMGWDSEGHRLVNLCALSALPTNFPGFVNQRAARERIAFLGSEPDRWRNTTHYVLRHVNNPDHFIDLEDLVPLEFSITNLPLFRYEFVSHVARTIALHPERFPAVAPTNDLDRTRFLPGFLPWAITEQFARLKSAFSCLQVYALMGTAEEELNARRSVIYAMGVLGHYVGDAAQPLHTTRHYNGWMGETPSGYTTSRTFHGWIDGGYLKKVGLSEADVRPWLRPARVLVSIPNSADDDPLFRSILVYIKEQHDQVIPLYELEKSGGFSGQGEPGREGRMLLIGQLARAANMLADIWLTAHDQAPPDVYLQGQLARRQLEKSEPEVRTE